MAIAKSFIKYLETELPNLCTVKDLVRCEVYKTDQAAHMARKNGKGPPFFRYGSRGIVYCKADVIEFMLEVVNAPQTIKANAPPTQLKVHTFAQKPKSIPR